MKKICFILTTAYGLFNPNSKAIFGGAQIQLYLLAKELSTDYDVSFIVGDYGQEDKEIYENISVYKTCTPRPNDSIRKKIQQTTIYLQTLNKIQPDVCITSCASALIGIVSLYCKLKRKKHIHRTAHDDDLNGVFQKNNNMLTNKLYQFGMKQCSELVVQTAKHRQLVHKNYGRKATVLPNSFKIEKTIKAKREYVLWVARAEEWKRPEIVFEVAKAIPKEKIIMICPGDDTEYYNNLQAEAKKIKNIKFITYVPFQEIQPYFTKAKVFINTSTTEGYPNTFIQAGLAQTPICSLAINPNNIIKTYNCGLCANNNEQQFIEDIKKLLEEKNLWKEKSKGMQKLVEENHNIKKNSKIIKKIIESLT